MARTCHALHPASVSRAARSRLSIAIRQIALVAGAMLVYFGIRNVTAGSPEVAFANGDRIAEFEQQVHTAWEDEIQSVVADHDVLVTVTNWVYIWGHWPVILTCAALLLIFKSDRYFLL